MRVLLVSTYELGHQPLHLASPAAALRRAGHEVACLDLSVQPWDAGLVAWAQAAAFSVPMHTAMRLALPAARRVRQERPGLPLCFYGLYAPVSRDLVVGDVADRVIAGEYEPGLVAWADERSGRVAPSNPPLVALGRGGFALPARDLLPPLSRYARLEIDGEQRLVGYVEATHGCRHTCRHCPVPAVYGGRIRVVDRDVVLDDIAQLVEAGARHLTFGDPDFLNAPAQSLRVVRALHERWPHLTFDVTAKVDHVVGQAALWPELAAAGCLFVVCALESVNDAILERLDKGHTTAQAIQAISLLRAHGIEVRPSFLPFTPWTTSRDVWDLLDFVADHDLIANTDPVHYTIRLLLPEGSLLLSHPDVQRYLGPYDDEGLTYTWTAADPEVDRLQARLARLVGERVGEPAGATYLAVRAEVAKAARVVERESVPVGSVEGRPRLTESWFC